MLNIKAKENSTVEVINGSFPIGERNTIKVEFEDDLIKQYMKGMHTYTCIPEQNMYSYGNFNNEYDIEKLNLNLNIDDVVEIASGFGVDYSRCLHCVSNNESQGLGLVELKPDNGNKLTIGTKYIFSAYVSCTTDTTAYLDLKDIEILYITDKEEQVKYEFTAEKEDFSVTIDILGAGECYIDNVQLFPAEQEIIENYYDNIDVTIEILNPVQHNSKLNTIINYSKPEDENQFILIFMPPTITSLDSFDNILCRLTVNVLQEPKVKILGDSHYSKIEECIYRSEEFILSGYILPPDSDRYELVVGSV